MDRQKVELRRSRLGVCQSVLRYSNYRGEDTLQPYYLWFNYEFWKKFNKLDRRSRDNYYPGYVLGSLVDSLLRTGHGCLHQYPWSLGWCYPFWVIEVYNGYTWWGDHLRRIILFRVVVAEHKDTRQRKFMLPIERRKKTGFTFVVYNNSIGIGKRRVARILPLRIHRPSRQCIAERSTPKFSQYPAIRTIAYYYWFISAGFCCTVTHK